jgi:hypothetical protein
MRMIFIKNIWVKCLTNGDICAMWFGDMGYNGLITIGDLGLTLRSPSIKVLYIPYIFLKSLC